jgi:hypothetical protein
MNTGCATNKTRIFCHGYSREESHCMISFVLLIDDFGATIYDSTDQCCHKLQRLASGPIVIWKIALEKG